LNIGIGLAIAATLAKGGAKKVYILGRRVETLKSAVESIGAAEGIVVPIICDVSNPFTINTAVDRIQTEMGYVDVLINNAGVSGPDHRAVYSANSISELQDIMLSNWPGWATTFAINTTAVVGVSASFLPLLDAANARRGWMTGKLQAGGEPRAKKEVEGIDNSDLRTSQIITIASIAAFNRFVTAGLTYNASKAGAVALGKTLASLLGPWGIRSNVIAPGSEFALSTSLLLVSFSDQILSVFPSEMTAGAPPTFPCDKIPAGRQGNFEEISGTILYLVGKAGGYVNGNVQVVDGGRLGQMPATY
jgi:NAD(P)-dependent dehydrogenase (short-subunit alcohol dehydrogenase family)